MGMTQERRRHSRATYLDATWVGAKASGISFVSNLSVGGCYVHSQLVPAPREAVTIVVDFGFGETMSLRGRVVAPARPDGFGVAFIDMGDEAARRLERLLGRLTGEAPVSAGTRHERKAASSATPRLRKSTTHSS